MRTGHDFLNGHQPVVRVTERVLISQIPEEEREDFEKYLGENAQRTRSGEVVFDRRIYQAWKLR